jgi:hypothetical protein
MKEHRRISFTGGVIDTPDPDWAGTHTPWAAGADLEAGDIAELSPRGSRVIFSWELYDGVGDGAATVAPGSNTIDVQIVTRRRNRGVDVFDAGVLQLTVAPQTRQIEFEMPSDGVSVVRVVGSSLTGTGGIWIYASEDVDP